MFLLTLFLALVSAKCGLWYEFNRDSVRDGPHTARGCSYCDSTYGWAFSYSFESMDKQETCNDLEMLEQCKRAQFIYDQYNLANSNPFVTLQCSDNVVCAAPANLFPYRQNSRVGYWCQNMDSYNICLQAKNAIEKSNSSNKDLFPISCNYATLLVDGRPVINYFKPDVFTTTTTTTTTTAATNYTITTVPPTTKAPSNAAQVLANWILLPLSLLIIAS